MRIRPLVVVWLHKKLDEAAKTLIRKIDDTLNPPLIIAGNFYSMDWIGFSAKKRKVIDFPSNKSMNETLKAIAQKARDLETSHVVTIQADQPPNERDLKELENALRQNREAVIVGNRKTKNNPSRKTRFEKKLPAFWYRLQTGEKLKDVSCPLRIYPVTVIENIKPNGKFDFSDTEILTRISWAGVAIKEVNLATPYPTDRKTGGFLHIFFSILHSLNKNVKLAMRSIAPIPHRKIVDSDKKKKGKISVFRPLYSIRTLLTANATPFELALASGMGVFIGTLPIIAFHIITILFAANYFRLNKVAAITASQLCTPPFVPALCIEAGYFLRHGKFLTEFSLETLGYQAHLRLWEWLLGSLILAPLLGLLAGAVVYIIALAIRSKTFKEAS